MMAHGARFRAKYPTARNWRDQLTTMRQGMQRENRMFMKGCIFCVTLLLCAAAPAADLTSQVDAYRQSHESAIVDQFAEFVRLKSVAANPEALLATAQYLERALKARGFETQLWSAGAGLAPVVFAALSVPHAKRTVIYYAHYDGQPEIGRAHV